jgi:hypothetical protein
MARPRPSSALLLGLALAAACAGGDLRLPSETEPEFTIVQGGNDQIGLSGEALPRPLIVRAIDGSEQGVAGLPVTWVVRSGGGTIAPAAPETDSDGFATARWTLGPVEGAQQIEARVPDAEPVLFTATATGGEDPAAPVLVEAVEGDDQRAAPGAEVPIPPAVRVLDADGDPVAGFGITFAVTDGGGSVEGAAAVTGPDGIARVDRWILGGVPGPNTLEARAEGLAGSPVVFTAEAVAPSSGIDRLVYLVAPPSEVGEDETFEVRVALVDADGDVVPRSGVEIYLALFRDGDEHPTNGLLEGDRAADTDEGIAVFELSVRAEGRFRLRALTDDLPELGPHGPEPFLFSDPFDVD